MANRPSDEELREQYRLAMEEWSASEDAALWEPTVGDGIEDEPARAASLPTQSDDSGGAKRRR